MESTVTYPNQRIKPAGAQDRSLFNYCHVLIDDQTLTQVMLSKTSLRDRPSLQSAREMSHLVGIGGSGS